ncbi:maternal protein tudor-like [Ixodes scapularis]|uniref:maternal protein tudor-like n=1 Tax=Ixodes scapularis TaxID=6945 RepID=UPI001C392411|nr:maternal protein tudor-like [Ixodes scapularis]
MSYPGSGGDPRAAESFKAIVTHVASEFKWLKIYVQRDYDTVEQIENYMQSLEQSLSTKAGFMHQGQIPLGTPCFARFTDNKWYRAVCSAWPKTDPTFVEVTFIDYGNPEILSVSDVRRGEDNIFRTPPLAMECFLDNVDMMLFSPQEAADVVVLARDKLLYEEVTVRVRRHEQVAENCIRPFVAIEPAEGGDLASLLDSSSSQSSCVGTPPVPSVAFRYQNVVLGKAYQAYVSHVESMSNVYLHLVDRDPAQFLESIQEFCANSPSLPASQVQEGTVCLSRFSEDGLLYRSLVIGCSGGQCKVLFVDYGNHEIKLTSELIVLPHEFLDEPVFAVRCTAVSTGLDKATFESLTADAAFTCRFVQAPSVGMYEAEFPDLAPPTRTNPAVQGQIRLQKLCLDAGNGHVMYVSFFESVKVMYAQLKEMVEEIEQISEQLAHESPSMPPMSPSDLSSGLGVACKYENIWYRAEVLGMNGAKVQVWLADYGDTVLLELTDLRHLDPKYTLQPAYAVKLSLVGLECDPQSADHVANELQKLVLDVESKVLICEVRPDGTHMVDMYINDPPVSVVAALQTAAPRASVKVPQPKLLATEKLIVTSVSPPNKFFGQLMRLPEQDLAILQGKLLEFYSPKHPNQTYQPQPGDYVSCRFSEDLLFYRAKVTSMADSGRCNVFYIDHGNEECVSIKDVFELTQELAEEKPVFGIQCVLESGTSEALLDSEVEVQIRGFRENEHTVSLVVGAGKPTSFGGYQSEQTTGAASAPVVNMSHAPKPPPQVIAEQRLNVGLRTTADVVFVASHLEFYCQLSQNEAQLNTLMDAIAMAATTQPPLSPECLEVGLPCCALYSEDGAWYRGVVTAVGPTGADVFFVDYGNAETVPLESLRALPPGLLALPRQALRCTLRDFQAPVSDTLTERLDPLLTEQRVTIEVFSNHSGINEVSVFLADGSSVADVLKREGFGTVGGSVAPPPVAAAEEPFVGGYQYPVLPEGVAVDVEVSWVLSPGEVYLQPTDSAAALTALMKQMQDYYNGPSCPTGSGRIRAGQACVSKYSEDGMWYRARVTHAKGGLLGIHYVDYGNCEEVPESSLRPLLPRFAELPAQAIRCRLRGVDPPGGSAAPWPPAEAGGPLQSIFEGPLWCRLVAQRDGVHVVNLERTGGRSEVSLVDALVSAGLAKAVRAKDEGGSASEASLGSKLRAVISPAEFSFQQGQFVDVKVVSVASAKEVWCCLPEGLDALLESLQKAGESAKKFNNPVPGEAAVARCPFPGIAGDWARALIRSRPSPAKLELFFVDLGLVRVLHHTEVKQIPQELTEQPGQAFQCSLDSGSNVDPGLLSARILGKELVLQVREQLDVALVAGSLFDTSGEEEVNVLDALSPPPVEAAQDVAKGIETEEAAAAPPKPQEPARAQEAARSKASPPRPQFNRSQSGHVILPCYPPLSKISGKMAVYVMHVDDLCCFYAMRMDQEQALDELSARLQERYATGQDPRVQLVPKLPCVALYSQDNLWYRAKVLNDSRVQFVDYGNADEVEEVREIGPEFLDVPPFCYKCKLDGGREIGTNPAAVKEFQELVLDAELELEVVTWGPEVTVRMSKGGQDVGALVKAKLAGSEDAAEDTPSEDAALCVLPAAKVVEGYVSHVDRLDSFYVITTERDDTLTELSESLQERLGAGEAAPLEGPAPGHLCAALYAADERWYRARIEGIGEEGTLSARFIDYGNAETVDSVVALTDAEAAPEPFCFECRLSGVSALDGDLLDKFKEATEDATLRVEVLEEGPPATVRLVDADGNDIAELLGVKVPEEPAVVEKSEGAESIGQADAPKKTYGSISVPLNQKLHVEICHSEGPTDFYVQLKDRRTELEFVATTLQGVSGDGKVFEASEGAPCVAHYDDGVYCRATVTSVDAAGARVFYVDYGNSESVELKEILSPVEALFEVPALAIRCTLNIVEADCVMEATEKFQALVDDESRVLLAEFLGERDGRHVVRLLDMGIDVLGNRATGDSTLEVTAEESPVVKEPTKNLETSSPSDDASRLSETEELPSSIREDGEEAESMENFETSTPKDVAPPLSKPEELLSSIEVEDVEADVVPLPEAPEDSKDEGVESDGEVAADEPQVLVATAEELDGSCAAETDLKTVPEPETDTCVGTDTDASAEPNVHAAAEPVACVVAREKGMVDLPNVEDEQLESESSATADEAVKDQKPTEHEVTENSQEQLESESSAAADEAVKDQKPTEDKATENSQEDVQTAEIKEQGELEKVLDEPQVEVVAKEAEVDIKPPKEPADDTEDASPEVSAVKQNDARIPEVSGDEADGAEDKEEAAEVREVVDKVCAAGADTPAAEVGGSGDTPTTNGAVGRLTPSPPPSTTHRKKSLDDCIVPGVCTNAELVEAPSASGQ